MKVSEGYDLIELYQINRRNLFRRVETLVVKYWDHEPSEEDLISQLDDLGLEFDKLVKDFVYKVRAIQKKEL